MSLDLDADQAPLTSVDELVSYFQQAERPLEGRMVGLEHEKLVYPAGAATAIPYDGERGVGALLAALEAKGYLAHREGPGLPIIALLKGALAVSLEPGGQLELSGTPLLTARAAHAENLAHLEDVREAAGALGLFPVALGYRPFDVRDQMPWMPKTRYRAMRDSLPRRGGLAKNMMLMTATGQASYDWTDEADCARKVEVAARLAPVLVALYANSPLVEGRPSGFLSYRSHVWTDVDPTRCGFLPSMLDGSFSYRAYVEWALDAPLLFLRRGGQYLSPELTFRQHLRDGYGGKPATRGDWVDHLSTLFPEVRIKRVLEVRSADCVSPELTGALAALWRGLFYDAGALSDAARILPRLNLERHAELMDAARRGGLEATCQGISLGAAARELVAVARAGLVRLDPEDAPLLEPLEAVAAEGRSPAVRVLAAWERDRDPARLLSQFRC